MKLVRELTNVLIRDKLPPNTACGGRLVCAAFSSRFLALSFSCSQTESNPAPALVTPAIRRFEQQTTLIFVGDIGRVKAIRVFLLLILLTTSLLSACQIDRHQQEQSSPVLTLTLDKIQCEEFPLDDKAIYKNGTSIILNGKIDYDPIRVSSLDRVILVIKVYKGSILRLDEGVPIQLHSSGTSTIKSHIDFADIYNCREPLYSLWFESPGGDRIEHQGDFALPLDGSLP